MKLRAFAECEHRWEYGLFDGTPHSGQLKMAAAIARILASQ